MVFVNIKSSKAYTVYYFNLLVFSLKNIIEIVNFANWCYHQLVTTKAYVYVLPIKSSTRLHVQKKHTKNLQRKQEEYFNT